MIRKRGKPKKKPEDKKARIFLYISPKVQNRFEEACNVSGKSTSEIAEKLFLEYSMHNKNPENLKQLLQYIDDEMDEIVARKIELSEYKEKIEARLRT